MAPLDFTLPAADDESPRPDMGQPRPVSAPPAPAHPTRWQQFLLFIRSILTWWMEWIDQQLGA